MRTNSTIIVGALGILLVGGIAGYLVASDSPSDERRAVDTIPAGMHRMPDGTLMHHGTVSADSPGAPGHMMAMTVSSEREFIEEMIPHHQEAVDTAREVLARGATTPEIRQLAETIITTQTREIADMKQWYQAWYGEPYVASESYTPMMRELAGLTGAALDRAFLEDMIMHHMGAIMMAESVQPYVEHDEVAALAETILTSQTAEIIEMRQLLQAL